MSETCLLLYTTYFYVNVPVLCPAEHSWKQPCQQSHSNSSQPIGVCTCPLLYWSKTSHPPANESSSDVDWTQKMQMQPGVPNANHYKFKQSLFLPHFFIYLLQLFQFSILSCVYYSFPFPFKTSPVCDYSFRNWKVLKRGEGGVLGWVWGREGAMPSPGATTPGEEIFIFNVRFFHSPFLLFALSFLSLSISLFNAVLHVVALLSVH